MTAQHELARDWGLYIDGQWQASNSRDRIPSVSPSSGKVIATVSMGSSVDIDKAVEAARRASRSWASASPFYRAEVMNKASQLIAAEREVLARALSDDQGKPLVSEAYDEVDELVLYFSMAAEDAKRQSGSMPHSIDPTRRVLQYRVPLGVVGVISPWNWPYTMGAEVFAPALAAGNSVIWVPAPSTAACSALLVEIFVEAGFPNGVFNFVTGLGAVVGDALCAHPSVDGIGFVGSVATGEKIAYRAAGKRQILELGGNGPFVVLEDANLEKAAKAVMDASFLCAGQSCTAGELFLVQRSVKEEFLEMVVSLTKESIHLGDPFLPETTMGPLNNEACANKFDEHVKDAKAKGARVVQGGMREGGFPTTLYAQATILDGVNPDMLIASSETFGPVVPILEISSDQEAIELVNRFGFGLTSAVFTSDLARGLSYAESVDAGWVNVNASTNLWESHLPFGGRSGTLSGRGRVGGSSVLDAFSEPKVVILQL
ncbi:MAG: aldehyde dehydrogenase [Acidimicrobiaceae bacterium]|nr:aldehyde dehydrogenase [Acidimicrobiaceae bacterium]